MPAVPDRVRELREAWPGFLERQRKTVGQTRYGWSHPKRLSFVFGAQRSGTKMVMRILENSPATRIYHENHAVAFSDFELRSDATVRALVALNPAPAQIFKPICDSQRADELLDHFPHARGLWIWRHPDDVANSAMVKWGEHQREVVTAAVHGDFATWGWRTARLPESTLGALRSVWRPDLNPAEGALLFWYMRNAFFFALGLDRHPRMRLVNYEELVRDPVACFPAVFHTCGVAFDPVYVARVRSDSVRRREAPPAAPAIRELCLALHERFLAWQAPPEPVPSPVLLLINTLGTGGAERYVVTVANALAARGAQVVIGSTPGELLDQLRPDVRHVELPLGRVRSDLPKVALQTRRLLDDLQPAVIVANSLAVTWVARMADPAGRIPVVNVAHGWPAESYRSVGPLMRVADAVVAVSPEVREKLVAHGLGAEVCEVVENGVELGGLGRRTGTDRDRARASLGAGPDDLLVVTVGRTHPQKAQHHVITLAERLRDLPQVHFAIVGEGARDAELAELVRAAGVGDRVCLAGLRRDVPDLLGAADVYLSTSEWEGMSLTVIEAMASALPIVATRTEGAVHLVAEGCGVLVPVGDLDAMERELRLRVADPALRAREGDAAWARARARFGHTRMVDELVRVMARVAG